MTIAIILGGIAVLVVMVVIARNSSHVKREAREDLKREREQLKPPDIMDLVRQEAEESGVLAVPGADGVELPIRLKVWQRDGDVRDACDPSHLRFVLTEGVDAEAATPESLHLECDVP